jgi:hypothetical protein
MVLLLSYGFVSLRNFLSKISISSISAAPRSKVLKIASAKTTLPTSSSVPGPERPGGTPMPSSALSNTSNTTPSGNSSQENQPAAVTKSSNSEAVEDEKTDYVIPRPFFDTYALIKGLQSRNFTKEQAEALQSTFQAILNRR